LDNVELVSETLVLYLDYLFPLPKLIATINLPGLLPTLDITLSACVCYVAGTSNIQPVTLKNHLKNPSGKKLPTAKPTLSHTSLVSMPLTATANNIFKYI